MPDDPLLFLERGSAEEFWRVRLEPTVRINDEASVEVAVEQRVRAFPSQSGFSGVLPMGHWLGERRAVRRDRSVCAVHAARGRP